MRKNDVTRTAGTIRWPPPPRFGLLVIIGLLAIDTYLLYQIFKELKERGSDLNNQQTGAEDIGRENKLV